MHDAFLLQITNAPNNASGTSAVDPLENYFSITAVVFPAASRVFIFSRTEGLRSPAIVKHYKSRRNK